MVKSFLFMKESMTITARGMPIIASKTNHGTQSGADLIEGDLKIRTAIPRETMQNSERSIMSAIGYISKIGGRRRESIMQMTGGIKICLLNENITMPEKLTRSVLAQLRQKANLLAIFLSINLCFEPARGVAVEETVGHACNVISNTS